MGKLGGRPRTRYAIAAAMTAALLTVPPLMASGGRAGAATIFDGCAPAPTASVPMAVKVGTVACQYLTTHLLGAGIQAPFEYYVPPACDPRLGVRCPTLYLLHGFGGDYTEMLDTAGTTTSAWIQAETKEPPAGFESAPWNYYDPATWVTAPSTLPIILVAPLGQTLPGGYGPAAGQDSYWVDWNPKYGQGGSSPRYPTPPPKFESFLVDELAPFVETHLPAGTGRNWRAIAGVSLGGYGAYANGLKHPDEWTTMESVSGAHNFLFAPAPQPLGVAAPTGLSSPIPIAYTPLPAATGAVPTGALPSQVGTFLTALVALGDPVADEAYFRGNMPPDLAANARAYAKGRQAFGIDGFWNDMVARHPADVGSTPFEVIVSPMNVDMEEAFTAEGVTNTWAIHQGNHADVYRNAWFRGLEEFAYARLNHPDGRGALVPGTPTTFDYRSISNDFSVWGWRVHVDRQPVEFLTLTSVSCKGLTLHGSGVVTIKPPPACKLGHLSKTVDLGNPGPTDEQAGASALPVVGQTQTITFESRH
jgi:S-formylglutathione hydrolase FrmB